MLLKRQKDQVNHCRKRLRAWFNKNIAMEQRKVDQMVKICISATEKWPNNDTFKEKRDKTVCNRQNKRAINYCPMQSSNYDCNNHITMGNNS